MADLRHKRDTDALLSFHPRTWGPVVVAAPLALAATASAVTLGIVLQGPSAPTTGSAATAAAATMSIAELEDLPARDDAIEASERSAVVSRSQVRGPVQTVEKVPNLTDEKVTRQAIRAALTTGTKLWTTEVLNLWDRPGEKADQDGEIEAAKHVVVTGRRMWGRAEVVVQGRARWVTQTFLSSEKPVGAGAGLSMSPCADSSIEGGLTEAAVYVYRSVCQAFPQITTYGGRDNHGEHVNGQAIDIMVSDVELGTAIAEFLRANAAELDLYNVIWRQEIYTQERGGEGWRSMSDRGSATANHYDHVHVSVY